MMLPAPDAVLLDTAYVQALLSRRDDYHDAALRWRAVARPNTRYFVTDAVLVEVGNALSAVNRAAAASFIDSCFVAPDISIVACDAALLRESLSLYSGHTDKTWGFTDCISFTAMRRLNLTAALTTDRHFIQAGFRALMRELRESRI
ncbi:MAG: PIN domain-containing protein [Armatimonadetes bacterium]|nr:PIN domain-containing protein [Armatimonadota bacterium]